MRYRNILWHRIGAHAALLMSLSLPTQAILAQQPADSQADEGPGRGGVPGGQMVRGTISAINGDHLSVKAENGQAYDVVTTGNTRIMRQRQQVKLSDLKPGDGVGAAGVLDAPTHTLHAAFLFTVSAEDVRKAQENLGKTYITGRVTAIDDVKLTIQRPDGVAQVIEADENTSFRKGGRGLGGGGGGRPAPVGTPASPSESGESITLADIKVGDNIFCTGALHGNVFHPAELHVSAPRRHRQESSAPGAPSSATPVPNQSGSNQ